MQYIVIRKTVPLNKTIPPDEIGYLYALEGSAHQFVISGTQDGAEAAFDGSVTARFKRDDGNTSLIADDYTYTQGGAAVVILPQDCYNVPGRFLLTVFHVKNGSTTVIYSAEGTVRQTQSGALIDSGEAVDDIDTLLAEIGTMRNATRAAQEASAFYPMAYTGNAAFPSEGGTTYYAFANMTIGTTVVTPTSGSNTHHILIIGDLVAGETFTITARDGTIARPWGMADKDGVLQSCASGQSVTDAVVTVPESCAGGTLYVQVRDTYIGSASVVRHKNLVAVDNAISQLREEAALDTSGLELAMAGKTFSPVDHFSVGWRLGTLNNNTKPGAWVDADNRVRTMYIGIQEWKSFTASVDSGYKYSIYFYSGNTSYSMSDTDPDLLGQYVTRTDGWQTAELSFDLTDSTAAWYRAKYIRCVVADTSDADITDILGYGKKLTVTPAAADGSAIQAMMTEGLRTADKGSVVDAINSTLCDELYLGEFVQGKAQTDSSVDGTDTTRISMAAAALAFPCSGTYHVRINPEYKCGFRYGYRSISMNAAEGSSFWFANGDSFTLPTASAKYYRFFIARLDDAQAITPADADEADLHIWYDKDESISRVNAHQAGLAAGGGLITYTQTVSGEERTLFRRAGGGPVLAHTSDCHGDYKRLKRFYDFCDYAGVTAACVTGDVVGYYATDGFGWWHDLVKSHTTPTAFCLGNHDVYKGSEAETAQLTDAQVYSMAMEPIAAELGASGNTWYYRDFDDAKLRLISVNLYQYGGGDDSHRWYTHFTQTQLDWLIGALDTGSEKADYGVVILSHSPQLPPAKETDYPAFWQDEARHFSSLHNKDIKYNGAQASPLNDIVDAYISRGSISKIYTQAGTPDSLAVSHDFSGAHGIFVAHLSGHLHQDTVSYVYPACDTTHQMQLQLNITCTTAVYGTSSYPFLANISDIGRGETGVTQDAFNLYAIDLEAGVVRVIRVGNTGSYGGGVRDYMEIPYARAD